MIQMNSIFFRDIIKPDEPQDCKGGNKGDCSGDQRIDHVHGILTDIQADGRQTGTATAKTAHTGQTGIQAAQTTADVQEGNFFTRLWQRIVNLFKF